jgi:predicted permease
MPALLDDVRYALRSMRKNPGFTILAVASLALGIGVNTAIFSVIDQVLLWSLPARDPERLVNLEGGRIGAYPFYREYRAQNQVFSGMLASSRPLKMGVRPEGTPAVEVAQVCYLSGSAFRVLGVGAAAGRPLADSDDRDGGGSPVAILAYNYWQRRFAGKADVIGRKFAVNGYPLEVVGVAEKGFGGIFNGSPADVFVPLTMYPLTTPAAAAIWNTPNMHWLNPMARLKPGVSMERAQAEMRVLWPRIIDRVNDAMVKRGGRARKFPQEKLPTVTAGAGGVPSGQSGAAKPLGALLAATCLVLLIACANIASLVLARAASRQKEIAVRLSVGATRTRLVRQILTESLVLAAFGGAAGFMLAYWSVAAIAAAGLVNPNLRLQFSMAVLCFSAGVTLLTGILFGLAPALRITRVDLAQATKDSGAPVGGSRARLGKTLIAGQAALSLALLAGAGLFLQTLRHLEQIDLGFARENVAVIDVDATKMGYKEHRLRTFYDRLLERTRRLSDVRSAALGGMTPMGGYAMSRSFSAEGYASQPGEILIAYSNPVTEGYFTTLGIPLLRGRDFRPQDEPAITPKDSLFAALGRMSGGGSDAPTNASRVCILNDSLARRLFRGADPVGRHISLNDEYTAKDALEVVGVIKDIRQEGVRRTDAIGTIYLPSWSNGAEARALIVRFTGRMTPVTAAVQRELRDLDPNVPLLTSKRLEEDVNADLKQERMVAYLCVCLGALALALASVGLYGVTAYSVAQRTKEVGIRMALGAQRKDVMAMIVRQALVPVICGMVLGTGAALAGSRVVAGLLYGVAPYDPISYTLAAVALLGVALAAAAVPARRASRLEPVTALRHE